MFERHRPFTAEGEHVERDRHSRPVGAARIKITTAAAYAVAGMVHLVTAALFTGSLLLIVLGFRTVVQPLVGLVLLGLALALRPRPGRLNPDLPTLRGADAPALFQLLNEIADTCGVRRPDTVQFSPEFSITVTHYGFRRKSCLVLGLPLWAAYPPQQRIAALAHALAYAAPRNVRSRVFVATALESLTAGSETMRANGNAYISWNANVYAWRADDVAGGARRFNIRARTSEWLLWIPRAAMAETARLLLWLTLPATQSAQLEADDATARTASSEAAVAALNDQHLARAIYLEAHRLVIEAKTLSRNRSATTPQPDFWENVAHHAERLREKRGSGQSSGPDALTNPFDALRMARLTNNPQHRATIILNQSSLTRIANELRLPEQAVLSKVMRDGIAVT
ncbi:M48 family metallopeptidase [Streptomyces sp. Ag109_G2-15]|uniref:M48 family metallopeptidase n=1 Tax=Streptomyces sp. Ag109_G2-15 TaxID=1938850 RepID=UPI00117D9247|nr:M48 family metallopeptidase [Streptomyces sp. Ag109_G2-15]